MSWQTRGYLKFNPGCLVASSTYYEALIYFGRQSLYIWYSSYYNNCRQCLNLKWLVPNYRHRWREQLKFASEILYYHEYRPLICYWPTFDPMFNVLISWISHTLFEKKCNFKPGAPGSLTSTRWCMTPIFTGIHSSPKERQLQKFCFSYQKECRQKPLDVTLRTY